MGSLIEELRRREAAARAEADRLRTRIEELAEDLARAEEQATRTGRCRDSRSLSEPRGKVRRHRPPQLPRTPQRKQPHAARWAHPGPPESKTGTRDSRS
jgi:hypothetical protein